MPVALVTGVARAGGLAPAVVTRLRSDGWTVVTSDRASGDIACDLADADATGALVATVAAVHGPVSALVLGHAHDVEAGVLETTAEEFDRHGAVNARASLLMVAALARQVPAGGGAVVALTSDATTGNVAYGASKGALDRLVIAAARELGPRGISANVLNPGPVDTGWMDDEIRSAVRSATPLGRLGTPDDIAGVVAFLVSPTGRWVSGQLLHADGGFSARF